MLGNAFAAKRTMANRAAANGAPHRVVPTALLNDALRHGLIHQHTLALRSRACQR